MKIIILTILLSIVACLLEASPTTNFPNEDLAGEVELSIRKKLQERFKPKMMQVINECNMHGVPYDNESYFKVILVCDEFEGLSLIKRHRMVNEALAEELKTTVHALSITTKAPSECTEK